MTKLITASDITDDSNDRGTDNDTDRLIEYCVLNI